jgi:hypothetical protein
MTVTNRAYTSPIWYTELSPNLGDGLIGQAAATLG